jgi:hypothetical protein
VTLDTTRFGVTDIVGAVRLTADVLGLRSGEIRYDLPTRQQSDEAWSAALAGATERLRRNGGQVIEQAIGQLWQVIEQLQENQKVMAQAPPPVDLTGRVDELTRERDELRVRLDQAHRNGALRNVPVRLLRKLVGG